MITYKLENFTKGWFIGDFVPSIWESQLVEVAVKKYKRGDKEPAHHHAIATEFTVIIGGRCIMFEREFADGDIVVVEPFDITSFEALDDLSTVVVKTPSVQGDKYVSS